MSSTESYQVNLGIMVAVVLRGEGELRDCVAPNSGVAAMDGRGVAFDVYREIRRNTAKVGVDLQRTIYPRKTIISEGMSMGHGHKRLSNVGVTIKSDWTADRDIYSKFTCGAFKADLAKATSSVFTPFPCLAKVLHHDKTILILNEQPSTATCYGTSLYAERYFHVSHSSFVLNSSIWC